MDRLDAIRLFTRVVETGSFSAAAREAGIGQSAASKQIAALESRLGAALLQRTSRSVALTQDGQTLYESALRLVADVEALEASVGLGQAAPSGLVRMSVAPVFGRLHIVPKLPDFFARFPSISVEMSVSERRVNLIEDGIDLAIRHGELADSSLAVRKLATHAAVTVATPDYLGKAGIPKTPNDLTRHSCLIWVSQQEPQPWLFAESGSPVLHHPEGRFRTSDGEQLRMATLAGLGIAHGPVWLFTPEIASGRLQVVLGDYETQSIALNALYPSRRRLSTKVRLVLDFLVASFQGNAFSPAAASPG